MTEQENPQLPPARDPSRWFASTVKVGPKSQIVIPKGAREIFDIKPGDSLMLLADKEQGIALVPQEAFEASFAQAMPKGPGMQNPEQEE